VREAVRSLVEAGYLTRVQGSGTYVAFSPKLQHTLDRNLSYTKLITEAGYRPKRRVLTIEHLPLDNEEAKALDTRSEARGVRIERVRSADDRPVIYSIDVIPERYVREATTEDLSGSLYRLFGVMGHTVAHGEAVISPVVAISPMAEWLKVDHGSPLLHIRQVDYSTAGDAMMFSREWHVPGIFELSLLRRAT
jgi:DNA-binding GntR family transcriptional regulator